MNTDSLILRDTERLPRITARQREVLVGLRQRLTIKEIAGTMAVSESAVNQHIKALKTRLGVNSHREMVEALEKKDCSIPTARNRQLPETFEFPNSSLQDESSGLIEFGDSMTINRAAPWESDQPSFFRRLLDGRYAFLTRSAAIVIIAAGILIAAAAAFSVMVSLTYLEADKANVPAEIHSTTPG